MRCWSVAYVRTILKCKHPKLQAAHANLHVTHVYHNGTLSCTEVYLMDVDLALQQDALVYTIIM